MLERAAPETSAPTPQGRRLGRPHRDVDLENKRFIEGASATVTVALRPSTVTRLGPHAAALFLTCDVVRHNKRWFLSEAWKRSKRYIGVSIGCSGRGETLRHFRRHFNLPSLREVAGRHFSREVAR